MLQKFQICWTHPPKSLRDHLMRSGKGVYDTVWRDENMSCDEVLREYLITENFYPAGKLYAKRVLDAKVAENP